MADSARAQSDVIVQKGSILIYRFFDIAEEVDLIAVERILSEAKSKDRLKLARSTGKSIIMRNAPVTLSIGESTLEIAGKATKVDTFAKIWDYGVCSILFQVPIPPGTNWTQLTTLAAAIENQSESGVAEQYSIDRLARKRSEELGATLSTTLKKATAWAGFEDYVIYFLEYVEGIDKGQQLLARADIPALILTEPDGGLAARNRDNILEHVYQYRENDLVAIDWNSAVVFEPSGQRDIPDVLEFALTHLLEMRYYDDLIDMRLQFLYDSIEKRHQDFFRKSPILKLSHESSSRYIEFADFLERVENSLKVVGDSYLATIFRGALRRFRVPDWQQSISRKMEILARVSELLQGEINTVRSHFLEMIVIILIAFEIGYALLKVHQ